MKVVKICLFLPISVVLFISVLRFFHRRTASEKTMQTHETGPSRPEAPHQGDPHIHAEDTSHPHPHERPSDFMIETIKEITKEIDDPKFQRWLMYVESEEGRAFFDNMPSSDEWFEKSKSFGFFQETPEVLAVRDRLYRKHFPRGTVDENEPIIRSMMRDAILKHQHHKEEEYSLRRNSSVLIELLSDEKYLSWVEKKFGSLPPSSQDWTSLTFEEIRIAEREKYLAAEEKGPAARINDSIGSERPQSEMKLLPGDRQTPVVTRSLPDTPSPVEKTISDDVPTQQGGVDTLTSPVPESPELRIHKSLEKALRAQFSPDRFNRAMKTLNQYGPQEGLRKLKEADPELATYIEDRIQRQKEKE